MPEAGCNGKSRNDVHGWLRTKSDSFGTGQFEEAANRIGRRQGALHLEVRLIT